MFCKKKKNKFCKFCNNYIYLNDDEPYYFYIKGLGKFNKVTICYSCIKKKIDKVNNI